VVVAGRTIQHRASLIGICFTRGGSPGDGQPAGTPRSIVVARVLCRLAFVSLIVTSLLATTRRAARADLDQEESHALDLIRREPLRAQGFVELAATLFRRGDVTRAVAAAAEATRLEPGVARYQRLLGYMCAALGKENKAEAAFRRATELEPSVRAPLADFHLARAWAEYQEALRHGPPDAALEQRMRGIAAVAEINPELKMLMRSPLPAPAAARADFVPPVALAGDARYALVVEKRTQTARLYERSGSDLVLLQTYPCSTGQETGSKRRRGDRRTPDGVYVITDLRPGNQLPGIYGALAMPLSYPNAWDRRQRRGGDGIWIHGSDRLGAPFTPHETRGCVIMRDEDLRALARLITPGITPVLIAEDIPYHRVVEWKATVRQLLDQVPVSGLLAVVQGPEYTQVIHRDGKAVAHDFVQPAPQWHVVTSEQATTIDAETWKQKLADLLPEHTVSLLGVRVLDREQPPSVVIETSGPAEAHAFRQEIADRLDIDLPGVRPGPMPSLVAGNGPWVKDVRVTATDLDPPTTRLVIDLRQPAVSEISSEGNRILVSLAKE
jgi:tetratricopeptide (TPR) repeat protein